MIASLNAETHIVCRNSDACDEACRILRERNNNAKVFGHVCDVSNMNQVRKFADSFLKDYQRLDVLVNNAGCMPATRTLTEEGNESIMATAIGGTLLLSHKLVPALERLLL